MLTEAITLGLVSYRVWRLLAEDLITEPLRDRWINPRHHTIRDLWYCAWCSGSWWAIILGFATMSLTETPLWLLIPAAATVTGLVAVTVEWVSNH